MKFLKFIVGLAWLAISIFLAVPSVASAHPMSLDEAIRDAHGQSPRLQQALSTAEEMGWKQTESFSAFLPTVSVSANHFFSVQYQLLDVNFGGNPSTFPL